MARAADRTVFVATQSFTADVDGVPTTFLAGKTRVRAGHPVLDGRESLFEPMVVHYEVEAATAAPGERRGD